MSIERRFDVSLIAGMALREKQIQQNYRPIIGVHKWFARRPGTLFRGLCRRNVPPVAHRPQPPVTSTPSISTLAPFGSEATPMAARAG